MRKFCTIALAAFSLGAATTASAQDSNPDALIPVNVSLRLGVGLPIDSSLRDYGDTFIAFGAEYQIRRSLLGSGDTYFSLDFFKSDTSDEGYVIPFTINQRFYLRQLPDTRRIYAFGGLGVAFIKGSRWDQAFAARAGVGADLGERIFIESSVTITDKQRDLNGNLIGIYLGYRF